MQQESNSLKINFASGCWEGPPPQQIKRQTPCLPATYPMHLERKADTTPPPVTSHCFTLCTVCFVSSSEQMVWVRGFGILNSLSLIYGCFPLSRSCTLPPLEADRPNPRPSGKVHSKTIQSLHCLFRYNRYSSRRPLRDRVVTQHGDTAKHSLSSLRLLL